MDFSFASAISAAGMEAERTRLDIAAINLANIHTSGTKSGGPFKPLRVQISSNHSFLNTLSGIENQWITTPSVTVQHTETAPKLAYEPGHPDADAKGFVAYPGIDTVSEMVGLMTAVRAYEANVVAMNAAKSMVLKALEIGSSV
jgi:flagellar basal-body rod protein FlgC